MRQAARAIIVKDKDQLLLIHRNKFGQEYDILVGGGVDMGETPLQAVLREIQEETGVAVSQPRLVFIEQAGEPYGTQYIFLCQYLSGDPKLSPESTELKIEKMGMNHYQPVWRTLEELKQLPVRSESLKKAIINGLENGFPDQPIDITNA
jgi:8-oxo-dGTP diphosphatase